LIALFALLVTVLEDSLMQYLYNGDIIGFVVACYTSRIGEGFYAVCMLMLFGVVYNKTKSVAFCCILWLLIGGALIASMPVISPVAVIFTTLGLAGILFILIEGRNP
jgi:hypothetical protein